MDDQSFLCENVKGLSTKMNEDSPGPPDIQVVDETLNDKNKSYVEKIKVLILGWKSIHCCARNTSLQALQSIINYMHKYTLQYLLHGDWSQLDASIRNKLSVILHKVFMTFSKIDSGHARKCKLLIRLIREPWKNATLHKILHSSSPTENEVSEFITSEGSELLLMRLEILCEGKCEDLALKLAATLLKHLRSTSVFKKTDIDYVGDILLILLFKFKRNQEIIEKLKKLDLMEGLELIQRFSRRKTNDTGFWKYCDKVTEIASHTVLASCMAHKVETKDKQNLLFQLANEWALINTPKLINCLSTLCNIVRKIVQNAESPLHVYIFAQVLHKQLGDQIRPLCIELYIRGFTSNINLIEHFKECKEEEKVIKAEILLSNSFFELSELLQDNILIRRECLLTSFSLNPTDECLQRLREVALGDKLYKTDNIFADSNDSFQSNSPCREDALKTEESLETVNNLNILNSDLLGLSPHLCDDLSTVLSSARCQSLSWSSGWKVLQDQCTIYLKDQFSRKRDKGSIELKYLNIDYSQFENSKKDLSKKKKSRKKKIYLESEIEESKLNKHHIKRCEGSKLNKNILNYSALSEDIISKASKKDKPIPVPKNSYCTTNENKLTTLSNICHKSIQDADSCVTGAYSLKSYHNKNRMRNVQDDCAKREELFYNHFRPYLYSVPTPKPAETASDRFEEVLNPFSKSININPNVVLADVFTTRTASGDIEKNNVEIMNNKNDASRQNMFLAKIIPGMNSLDLIVPQRQEATVQVVQIPTPNTLQPVSSSSSSAVQTSSATIARAKPPLNDSIASQTNEIISHNSSHHGITPEENRDSAILFSSVVTQIVTPRSNNSEQLSSSHNNRPQNKPSTSAESTNSPDIHSSLESLNSRMMNVSHEGSTQVSAHIQRVGQPHKTKHIIDETKKHSNPSSNIQIPSTIQIFEEAPKHITSNFANSGAVAGSVYRLILKDGKILEQYCQPNQNLEALLSLPDVLTDPSQIAGQQDQLVKLLKKRKDKKEDIGNESVQMPSLPQFHQVFRRQVYQGGSICVEGTSISTSPRNYNEDSTDEREDDIPTTPLSKAVQTILKDAETSTKSNSEHFLGGGTNATVQTHIPLKVNAGSETKDEVQVADIQSPSGVIFACKVPISISSNTLIQGKPVTILKTNKSTEMIIRNPQKSESDSKMKDSVIRSNMNALLAAALQNAPIKSSTVVDQGVQSCVPSVKHVKVGMQESKSESFVGGQKLRVPSPSQKAVRKQSLVQHGGSRFSRPAAQSSSANTLTQAASPVVTIPLPTRTVHVLTTNINQNAVPNLSKVENRKDQITQNPDQTSVSSTTLEQLREFESVLEQVTNTSQMKERGGAKKEIVQNSSDFSNATKVNALFQTSLVSAISEYNNDRVNLTFINKSPTTASNTIISGNSAKITATTPVVVVQSCSRPLTSPALSIASQSSPTSPATPPANSQAKIASKLPKPKTKSIGKTAPTATLKVSTLPKPQQKPQEDEQTTQRIYAILDKYAEQLRNSPELKNKPAPRRRSNPPTNPSQSSKRKKSSQKSKSVSNIPSCSGLDLSPSSEDLRTVGSEDSSNGVSQVTQTINSPQSRTDEHSNQGDISSEMSEPMETKDQRSQHRILLTDPTSGSGRAVIVQENLQPVLNVDGAKVIAGKQLVVGSGATVPLTLQLPGTGSVKQVLFPVPADGRPFVVAKVPKMYRFHQVTMPSGSPILASTGSGAVLLRQMCLNKPNSGVKQVKVPVVSQIASHNIGTMSPQSVVLPSGSQSFTLATGTGIEGDIGIALDNTLLLNSSSSSSSSSIGFIQRNIKSSQPNVMNCRTSSQECPPCSTPNEILVANINPESTIIKTETLTGEASNASCQADLKEEVKYSVTSESPPQEKTQKVTHPGSSGSWSNIFKEVKSETNASSKTKDKNENKDEQKKDQQDLKGCEGSLDPQLVESKAKSSEMIKQGSSDHSVSKQQTTDNITYCNVENPVGKTFISSQNLGDHWQFNIKLEKVCNEIKGECLREGKVTTETVQNIVFGQPQGLKRKVENTIFQIAFKRDKLKLTKEEIVQQRSAHSLERELRLQKSLSEECEDLGVDKPSTSDLFPEAELLLDSDPLSRDSIQGELFTRNDYPSSSFGSPSRSPIFSSKTSFWKKQKRVIMRHKANTKEKDTPVKKSDSDRVEQVSSVKDVGSNTIVSETVESGNNFKHNQKQVDAENENTDVSMECNDSDNCHFSDVEDHCRDSDNLDSGGDSDDFLQKSNHECKHDESSVKKDQGVEKTSESPLFNRLTGVTYSNCHTYANKDSSLEKDNSPWYQMMRVGKEEEKKEEESQGNECHNGVSPSADKLKRSSPPPKSQSRKKKKVGLFVSSLEEESASSLETIFAGPGGCSELHHSFSKRSSSRGRIKKGCPCFNGSSGSNKKKRDLPTPTNDKTEKPSSTKSVFPLSCKKTSCKNTGKQITKKR